MSLLSRIKRVFEKKQIPEKKKNTTEKGSTFDGNSCSRLSGFNFYADLDYCSKVTDAYRMDQEDGRVKQLHNKIARDAIRGGFYFSMPEGDVNKKLKRESDLFVKRCKFNKRKKLKSHARHLARDGELIINWVIDKNLNVVSGRRLPPKSISLNVDDSGKFRSLQKAYIQKDNTTGKEIAHFAFWEITHIRLDANEDDPGERGRPWTDAERVRWKKLDMAERDLVIRRKSRAPDRKLHILEGATEDELKVYKARNKDALENLEVQTDYFSNKKGGVTSITGDSNLDQIKDIVEQKTDFFCGNGIPPHLMGYVSGISRDIYDDTLKGYYEILEEFQELLADAYEEGLRLQYLLKGINADGYVWELKFKGRKVESDNQKTDRMLKVSALGIPKKLIWADLGYSVEKVLQAREDEAKEDDPYAARFEGEINGQTAGKITNVQGNQRNKESAVSIGN